jgi:DNA-binding NarL/FixJ family response regulator
MQAHLTSRQKTVCNLLTQGLRNREISTRLGISHRTVEDHRSAVFKKLGVRNVVQLVRKMILEGRSA